MRKRFRRRGAIELVRRYLKSDFRIAQNFQKWGKDGIQSI